MTLLQSKLRLVTSGEAELAMVQENVIDLARDTRQSFEAVGELYARVARSSKELGASQSDILKVVKAVSQAIQISGNSAHEAEAGMIQLSQALASGTLRGDELRSVLEQMPRVAQAIAEGLGVTVGQLRKFGAEGKLTSQQVFQALISQSEKLNEEFSKLTPTIGQSFTVLFNELKRTTSELLRSSGATDALTFYIKKLSEAIRAVPDSKLSKAIRVLPDFAKFIGEETAAMLHGAAADDVVRLNEELELLQKMRGSGRFSPSRIRLIGKDGLIEYYDDEELDREIKRVKELISQALAAPATQATQVSSVASPTALALTSGIEEFRTTLSRIDLSPYQRLLEDMDRMTQTSTERQIAHFREVEETLKFLLSEGKISTETFNARMEEARGNLVQEIDIESIRNLYKPIRRETTELGEFMKGVWQGVGQSIQSTLSDAIYEWRFSWRSIIDITRRALADILSAILTSGIKQGLMNLLKGDGGFFSGFVEGISGFFGLAGGGIFDGPRIVGEDGPEVVTGRGRVFNMRQLAFAGAGASINYAPTFNLSIQSTGDEETRQRMIEYVETRIQQSQSEFVRVLNRSGVEVKG